MRQDVRKDDKILMMDKKRRKHLFFAIGILSCAFGILWLFYFDQFIGNARIISEYGPLFHGFFLHIWMMFVFGFFYTVWSLHSIIKYTDKMEKNLEEYVRSIKVGSLKGGTVDQDQIQV